MKIEDIENFELNFPYLSGFRRAKKEYIGITFNSDDKIITFYDYMVINEQDKPTFIQYGEEWWWGSNRKIPIGIFLKDMRMFKYSMKTFTWKETTHLFGPIICIDDIVTKRVKRKQIQLVKKVS